MKSNFGAIIINYYSSFKFIILQIENSFSSDVLNDKKSRLESIFFDLNNAIECPRLLLEEVECRPSDYFGLFLRL